jgi:hypothetical protein
MTSTVLDSENSIVNVRKPLPQVTYFHCGRDRQVDSTHLGISMQEKLSSFL